MTTSSNIQNTSMQASKQTSVEEVDFTKDIVEVFEMEQSPEHCATESPPPATEPPLPKTESPLPKTDTPAPPLPPDFEKYWKSVQAYPEEFNTWTYLLQYVEQENHLSAVRKAFDAFLAHYPYCYGYWKKYADLEKKNNNILEADEYAKYMENHSVEGVRHVYSRACNVHLAKKPMVHLQWAAFEEQQGNLEEARRILKNIETSVEGLAMVRLRRVNLERRHGNVKEAEKLLEEAMNKAKTCSESSFYAIKLSRHLSKVQADVVKARKVLSDSIQKDKENTKLYLNLLELEYNCDFKQNEENILSAFDKAIKSPMPIVMRVKFSQRKVEFLEDFGSDVKKLLDTYNEHQKLLKDQDLLKRKAENGLEQPETKRLHTEEVSTVASVPVTTASVDAAQSGYNYGSWYQYNYPANWNYGQYYNTPST